MTVFDAADFDNHHRLAFFTDPAAGLRAIIAIHRLRNGIAGGGIRMWPYDSDEAAIADALRLSRAMSYKFALADLPVGGGKTVVIGDSRRDKNEDLLRALGRAIDSLGGCYICGPDVGTTPEDMVVIGRETDHARGRPGESGDTSPATGFGVYHAIRAAAGHELGNDDLRGVRVAVQGAGAVGRALCRHLCDAGAEILIADIDPAAAAAAADFGASVVSPDEILAAEAEVLAPCALGAVLNDRTIPAIRAKIVCGGANNQLAEERHGAALAERGVLYVPDYVANAGGAINAVAEGADYDEAAALARTARIYDTCRRVFEKAEAEGIASSLAADRLAEEIIDG
ncbi:MAG: Glu/Leu/Phe/Val dehydrogenase dimerization domain-containing protein [Alphaproteobacteria bacterium]|nr:Glu/Leu/Phe/Val dehydrogenase dimerization domain-containing protein [Alphaproteobacteria bacterium]